jgi:hypothetical protein
MWMISMLTNECEFCGGQQATEEGTSCCRYGKYVPFALPINEEQIKPGDIIPNRIGGIKHDKGKPQMSLVSYESIAAEARAMTYGKDKYGRNNYKQGIEYTRIVDACIRHLTAWTGGEDNDPESSLNHIDHAKACLGILSYYLAKKVGKDDR